MGALLSVLIIVCAVSADQMVGINNQLIHCALFELFRKDWLFLNPIPFTTSISLWVEKD